jgi:hypothetical protein
MTRRPLTYVLATHAGGPVASCAGQTETDLSLRLIAAPNDSDPRVRIRAPEIGTISEGSIPCPTRFWRTVITVTLIASSIDGKER